MEIYIGHSSSFDFETELYEPLQNTDFGTDVALTLPHSDDGPFESEPYLKQECDLFIAEVSYPSTGLGIELGWADAYDVDVVCIHRNNQDISGSIPFVFDDIREYSSGSIARLVKSIIDNYD